MSSFVANILGKLMDSLVAQRNYGLLTCTILGFPQMKDSTCWMNIVAVFCRLESVFHQLLQSLNMARSPFCKNLLPVSFSSILGFRKYYRNVKIGSRIKFLLQSLDVRCVPLQKSVLFCVFNGLPQSELFGSHPLVSLPSLGAY